jgi:MFS family permease
VPETKQSIFRHPGVIAFMAIIAAIEFIRMSLFIRFLPSLMSSLHFATIAIGIVISANLYTDNLSKSAIGWLVDHRGPWPVLLAGSITTLLGIILIINFHQSLFFLIMAAILIGLGVAPTWPAAISGSIQTVGEEKRATIISIISVVWLSGGGLGPVLMGFLIDPRLRKILIKFQLPLISAYKTCLIILFAVAVLAVIIAILGLIGWRKVPHLHNSIQTRDSGVRKTNRLKDILSRLWKVKGLVPGMFIQTLSLGMLVPNLESYATGKLGLSEVQLSLLFVIGGAFVVSFMIPVGHMADKFGSRGFLVAGFTLAAASLFVMVHYGNINNIWWLVGFVGLSYALIQPAWNALLAGSIPPGQRGVLMGLFMSVEGMGFATGPLLGGYLGSLTGNEFGILGRMGSTAPFYISSVLLLIMALVYLIYPFHVYQIEET